MTQYVLTEDEFRTIYQALHLATSGFDDDEVVELMKREERAFRICVDVRERQQPKVDAS